MFNNNLVYYSKYALDLHSYQGLILGVLNGVTFIAVPAWAYIALKLGKKNTWLTAMAALFIGFLLFYYLPINGLNELLYVLAFIGLANGATGVLFWSMLPDTIEFEPNEVQSAQTISDLKTLMTLIPIVGICISFILMWFYPIDKKFHSQLIADIQNRGIS
jgi:GPH family glycoside/pentoside/hexuronide:cation symporter